MSLRTLLFFVIANTFSVIANTFSVIANTFSVIASYTKQSIASMRLLHFVRNDKKEAFAMTRESDVRNDNGLTLFAMTGRSDQSTVYNVQVTSP